MYHASRKRTAAEQHVGPVEIVCVLVVLAAVVALVAWIIATAGGGALMT